MPLPAQTFAAGLYPLHMKLSTQTRRNHVRTKRLRLALTGILIYLLVYYSIASTCIP